MFTTQKCSKTRVLLHSKVDNSRVFRKKDGTKELANTMKIGFLIWSTLRKDRIIKKKARAISGMLEEPS